MESEIDWAHAKLMEAYITKAQRDGYELLGVEIPWSHYGNRGVLDAALRSREMIGDKRVLILAEFKTRILDVGRCIRQVQLVRKYFMQGIDRKTLLGSNEHYEIHCPLILMATVENVKQVVKYHHLFRDIDIVFFNKDRNVECRMYSQYEIRLAIKHAQEDQRISTSQNVTLECAPESTSAGDVEHLLRG